MPRYIIERDLPGLGQMTEQELRTVAQHVCSILHRLDSRIQWVESFVTDEKMYCIYTAPSETFVREHARRGGLPANRIAIVRSITGPAPGDG